MMTMIERRRTHKLLTKALVLSEEVADDLAIHANVTSGDVGIGANVAGELGHERLAEAHDFQVGLALGVKVGTALAACTHALESALRRTCGERTKLPCSTDSRHVTQTKLLTETQKSSCCLHTRSRISALATMHDRLASCDTDKACH